LSLLCYPPSDYSRFGETAALGAQYIRVDARRTCEFCVLLLSHSLSPLISAFFFLEALGSNPLARHGHLTVFTAWVSRHVRRHF
jgi:hypothetical protein